MTQARNIVDLILEVIADTNRVETPDSSELKTTQAITKQLGLKSRTVRFYSEVGIATPLRRGTTRLFTPSQIHRLALARELRGIGMEVAAVAELLDRLSSPGARQKKLAALPGIISDRTVQLLQREQDIRRQHQVTTRLLAVFQTEAA